MMAHTTRILAFILAILAITHALPELIRRSPNEHSSHHVKGHHGNIGGNNNGGKNKTPPPAVPAPNPVTPPPATMPEVPDPKPAPVTPPVPAKEKPLPGTADMGDASGKKKKKPSTQSGQSGGTSSNKGGSTPTKEIPPFESHPAPLSEYKGTLPQTVPYPVDVFTHLPEPLGKGYVQCNAPFSPNYKFTSEDNPCWARTVDELMKCQQRPLIVMNNIVVKSNEHIDLALITGARLFVRGTIKFEYRKISGDERLLTLTGKNILFTGLNLDLEDPYHKFGVLDGQGQHYWDGKGDGGNRKPKLLLLTKFDHSIVSHLTILNSPVQASCISQSQNSLITDFRIDNIAGGKSSPDHPGSQPAKNTDGIDVNRLQDSCIQRVVGYTQDDLICLNSGNNIVVQYCFGYVTHGISGAVMSGATLSNVLFHHNAIFEGMFGYRLKLVGEEQGTMSDLTYVDNHAYDPKQYHIGIVTYSGGTDKTSASSHVKVSNVSFKNHRGEKGLLDVKVTARQNIVGSTLFIKNPQITGVLMSNLKSQEYSKYLT